MQAIELEERQEELTAAAEEVRAQRDELSATAAQLADEKRRAEHYGAFADSLAAERDARVLAWIALSGLVEAAGADVGVLYGASWRDQARWTRLAAVGLDPALAVRPRRRRAVRASAARAVVAARRASSWSLRRCACATLAGESPVRWELHVPLQIGERSLGVATVGGVLTDGVRGGRDRDRAAAGRAGGDRAGRGRRARAAGLAVAGQRGRARRRARGDRAGRARHELVFANAAMEQLATRLSMPIGAAIGADRGDLPAEFDGDVLLRRLGGRARGLRRADGGRARGLRVRAGALHGADRRRARRADRAPGGAARRHPRARGRPAQVDAHADRLARAAHAAGVGRGLHGAAAHAPAGRGLARRRSSAPSTARPSGSPR